MINKNGNLLIVIQKESSQNTGIIKYNNDNNNLVIFAVLNTAMFSNIRTDLPKYYHYFYYYCCCWSCCCCFYCKLFFPFYCLFLSVFSWLSLKIGWPLLAEENNFIKNEVTAPSPQLHSISVVSLVEARALQVCNHLIRKTVLHQFALCRSRFTAWDWCFGLFEQRKWPLLLQTTTFKDCSENGDYQHYWHHQHYYCSNYYQIRTS